MFRDFIRDYCVFIVYTINIEKSVEYIQLKSIFDELFNRVAERIEVVPKVEKIKTQKQIENMKKKALMDKLMKVPALEE